MRAAQELMEQSGTGALVSAVVYVLSGGVHGWCMGAPSRFSGQHAGCYNTSSTMPPGAPPSRSRSAPLHAYKWPLPTRIDPAGMMKCCFATASGVHVHMWLTHFDSVQSQQNTAVSACKAILAQESTKIMEPYSVLLWGWPPWRVCGANKMLRQDHPALRKCTGSEASLHLDKITTQISFSINSVCSKSINKYSICWFNNV